MTALRHLGLVLALLASAPAAILAAGAARAQTLAIQPVTVQLAPGQMAATVTVVNQGTSDSAFQVRPFAWDVQDGQDRLSATDQLIASPPLGTIAPGGTQLIRLVLHAAAQGKEAAYRIWIDQIPSASEAGAVRIALRVSIPVFAEPDSRVAPALAWHVALQDGKAYLVADNSGTRHESVRDIVLSRPGGGAIAVEGGISPHVLAGASRRWRLDGALPGAGSQLRITAHTDGADIDQTVAVGPRP